MTLHIEIVMNRIRRRWNHTIYVNFDSTSTLVDDQLLLSCIRTWKCAASLPYNNEINDLPIEYDMFLGGCSVCTPAWTGILNSEFHIANYNHSLLQFVPPGVFQHEKVVFVGGWKWGSWIVRMDGVPNRLLEGFSSSPIKCTVCRPWCTPIKSPSPIFGIEMHGEQWKRGRRYFGRKRFVPLFGAPCITRVGISGYKCFY